MSSTDSPQDPDAPIHRLENPAQRCPRCLSLHPATWLLLWLLAIVALPGLSWPTTLWLLLALMLLLATLKARAFLTLCYKSRFLLAILAIVSAWKTPGRAIVGFDDFSLASWVPTIEGLFFASVQIVNLLVFIALVSLCLTLLTPLQWVIGLYRLISPLPGIDAKRFAIRFMLVFEALGKQAPIPLNRYPHLFDDIDRDDDAGDQTITLYEPRLDFRDIAVGLTGVGLLILFWWRPW